MKIQVKELGLQIGSLPTGKRNSITDVKGVKVGHVTYNEGETKTGITAIIPHEGNIFKEKLIGATDVINGFGKSIGTIQINELGTIESPILLTNTLSVGVVTDGLVRYMLEKNEDIGLETGTINPIVGECNDGGLNTIRNIFLTKEDVFKAIDSASEDFEEGAVGAGTGMVCYDMKGGIGSSSRLVELDGDVYTVGVLVLSNFGEMSNFVLAGTPLGKKIKEIADKESDDEEQGSIITVLGTDAPLSARQLKRVCRRVYPGVTQTGSFAHNGSGEVVFGFSTANKINHYESKKTFPIQVLNEDEISVFFKATKEATEEAVLSSLLNAKTTVGRAGRKVVSLREYLEKIR